MIVVFAHIRHVLNKSNVYVIHMHKSILGSITEGEKSRGDQLNHLRSYTLMFDYKIEYYIPSSFRVDFEIFVSFIRHAFRNVSF